MINLCKSTPGYMWVEFTTAQHISQSLGVSAHSFLLMILHDNKGLSDFQHLISLTNSLASSLPTAQPSGQRLGAQGTLSKLLSLIFKTFNFKTTMLHKMLTF